MRASCSFNVDLTLAARADLGGLGCLFFMGIFMKRVNAVGATVGLVVNYAVCFALDALPISGKPHLLLYGAIGMAACLVVAPIVSAVVRASHIWRSVFSQ